MSDYTWQPECTIHYPLIEHVELSPDGQRVLFTVRTAYMTDEASEFRNQVMLARTDGASQPVQLTFGQSASLPRWSPDGRFIAFIRKGEGEKAKPGLWAMRAEGGEAWPLTGEDNGVKNAVANLRWSPDGRHIAFITVPWDEEKERRQKQRDDVIHWRVDYDFPHLHVLDFAVAPTKLPTVTQLTSGQLSVNDFAWSPDSRRIAFTHMPAPLVDLWPQTRLATIAANGSEAEPTDVGLVAAWDSAPAYSPDGRWIAVAVGEKGGPWAFASHTTLFPTGSDVNGGQPLPLADVPDEQPVLVGWAPDSTFVYVKSENGLRSELIALPVGGAKGVLLFDGEKQITFKYINAAGQVALVVQDFHEPNSVYVADLAKPNGPVVIRKVAQPTLPDWPEGPLPQVKLLRWHTPDGFDIEGILYLPADYDETSGRRLPLLLHIHGGPTAVFQRQYVGTPYYYTPAAVCERGIAVLRCNPRGSGGYGKAFRFANRRDWGGGDFRDLQQGVDTVIEMGIADPERLGVCGWSYGGFMTSWTITQTDRFKAASIGAAVTNPMSFNGTSDIPGFIPDYFGAEFWEDIEAYREHSPIFHVDKVKTPAIIQHGADDERVPLEQGLQYYNALKRRGVPVEMFIYPRQPHNLTEPRLLIDAAHRNLEWFGKMIGQ